LFGLPANELTNQSADIKTLCGKEGEILEEKIILASGGDERVRLACDFFNSRLKNIKSGYSNILSSIKTISNAPNLTSIKVLSENNFLSVRQFERKFKEFSGFSPKLFLRITRFNSLLDKPYQNKSLAQMAYEYGYYDQSHFIHDFQQFSGHRPKKYFAEDTVFANDRGTIEFGK
jgi:methylphosphotriester-DNA--protein-cysteine methyltransferase